MTAKRTLGGVIAAAVTLAFAGCGADSGDPVAGTTDRADRPPERPPTAAPAPAPPLIGHPGTDSKRSIWVTA